MGRLPPPLRTPRGARVRDGVSVVSCVSPRAAPRALARGGRFRRLGSRPSRRPRRPRPPPTRSARSRLRSTPRGRPPRAAPPRGSRSRTRCGRSPATRRCRARPRGVRDRGGGDAGALRLRPRRRGPPRKDVRRARYAKERLRPTLRPGPIKRGSSFAAADEDDPREARPPRSQNRAAAAHRPGLEIDGRVLDVAAARPWALCDAARRLEVDYSDPERMAERFGNGGAEAPGYAPAPRARSSCWASRCPSGEPERGRSRRSLTLETPPERVEGASGGGARRRVQGDARGGRPKGRWGGERGRPRGGNAAGGGGGVPARRGGRHRDGQGREGARGEAQRRRSLAEEDEERSRVGSEGEGDESFF